MRLKIAKYLSNITRTTCTLILAIRIGYADVDAVERGSVIKLIYKLGRRRKR